MNEPKTARLKSQSILDKIRKADLANVFIGLGACVDPDGLASQLAMKTIVETINPEAKISCYYRGEFDRAQNKTMREVLELSPKPYSEFKDDGFTCLIMVDGPASVMPKGVFPTFIIDHHDQSGDATEASDVRMIGSCSAILWEYLMELNPELLEGEGGAKLATALAIGITTDTEGKTVDKTSRLDWEAEAYCGMRSDIKLYSAIKNYPRPSYQKDIEMQGWANKKIEGTVLVTQLGIMPVARKGAISSVAAEFCGQGPVRTTLVAGMVNGDIHFSFRTLNTSINADEFIKKILTKFGGGKPGAGAGYIQLPGVCKDVPINIQEAIFLAIFNAVAHKTFEYAGDGVRAGENGEIV